MQVISVISTKGGVGKTTISANLGGFLADAGLRILLVDLDIQPTLSSYFQLRHRASGGTYELLAFNERNLSKLVSRTSIEHLDVIVSNDNHCQLNTLLLQAPDGRLRLRNLLSGLTSHYDLLLIDTQGARSVMLEMAVLASDLLLSPVTPDILSAREMRRGTLQLLEDISPYRHLGISLPPLHLVINRLPAVSANAHMIQKTLRRLFQKQPGVRILDCEIPANEAIHRAAVRNMPVHRVETRRPSGRVMPAAMDSMHHLARELFPQWHTLFDQVCVNVAKRNSYVERS
ncbi:ParA family protein [Lelliottia amnigena]|uniref:ParA family protein n=1 Tax=Lelliottia amnigena TaxID=61646 RepID=UPI0040561E4C